MSVVFFGTPEFAAASLEAVLASRRKVSLVVTQPDRPAGRGRKVTEPPVKRFAIANDLPTEQPKKLRDESFLRTLRGTQSKLFIVAAYGRILPPEILAIPGLILNVHASLLPRWRGAAPIARAILAGDAKTGISIMKLVQELDAGDVLLQRETGIGTDETCGELTERLSKLGGEILIEALELIECGKARFTPQDVSRITLAPAVSAEEAKIDWGRSAQEIHNQARAFNPWPGAFATDGKQRIKVWRTEITDEKTKGVAPGTLKTEKDRLWVATGDRWLEVSELQREGKARQGAESFLPGYSIATVKQWS